MGEKNLNVEHVEVLGDDCCYVYRI